MRLSQELRLIIWDMAIRGEQRDRAPCARYFDNHSLCLHNYSSYGDNPAMPRSLPAICYVSKKTQEETLAVVIEGSNLLVATLTDSNSLQSFLEAAPGRLGLCRELKFRYQDNRRWWPEKDADLELAGRCPNLRKIHLSFSRPLTRLSREKANGYYPNHRVSIANSLMKHFKLERLLDCQSLESIRISHHSRSWSDAKWAAEEIGKLLNQKFAEKRPKQVITVQSHWVAPGP
jgi:hypothetical protein